MTENTNNNNSSANKKQKQQVNNKPKFNMTYFYVLIIVALLGINIFTSGNKAVETTWHEVKTTMIKNNDIERIVVINREEANVYLKKDSYEKI
jgi:cell division protease FtsH